MRGADMSGRALLLRAAQVVSASGVLAPGWVRVRDGVITAVGGGDPTGPLPDEEVPSPAAVIVPGLVDLHCHGGGGASFSDLDPSRVRAALDYHRQQGTTTQWASLVTAPLAELVRSIELLRSFVDAGTLDGIHLEGPFISPLRRGAQNPASLLAPDRRALASLLDAGGGAVRMVTIAPELPGALELIADTVAAGALAAIGHSDATYAQACAAIDAGARVATHLFNGMRPLHHREPGPILALCESSEVVCELIPDGHHLHPAIVAATVRRLGTARVHFVTDAMAAAGMPEGRYLLGGLDVAVRAGRASLVVGGSLAGSTISAAAGLRWSVREAGITLADATAMAASTPSRLAGHDERGRIEPGRRADLLLLDEELRTSRVLACGDWAAR